jgi:alkanesulfonate monooxygenase SsuD/methylene tetrahydromethanopterin reductase-like flavin-dependent oxidoreductase (luciferase family)
MADNGHDLRFGYFLLPDHGNPAGTLRLAKAVEELGFDLIGIQDHPYRAGHYDTFALIATILAQTERVRVFPDVANLPLRPPAMLAKTAATLDELSGGRFELGLGAGAFPPAVAAWGGPQLTPGVAVSALEEAIAILRAFWSGGRSLTFDGEHYRVRGIRPGPRPAHEIGIWLGALGPRMLRVTGRLADGWVPSMSYVPPAQARDASAVIDVAAREAGRDPAAIRRIYNIGGQFTTTAPRPFADTDREITGPPDHWVEVLTELALDPGFSTFVLWSAPDPDTLRRFTSEVVPAVRERVATARTSPGTGS